MTKLWIVVASAVVGAVAWIVYAVFHSKSASVEATKRKLLVDNAVNEVTHALDQQALSDAFEVAKKRDETAAATMAELNVIAGNTDKATKAEDDAHVVIDLTKRGFK